MKNSLSTQLKELIKILTLPVYNRLLPNDSRFRHRLYNQLLWRIFPDPLDKLLRELTRGRETIRFIEIGANDGIAWDPLFKFIKRFEWEGILIEPHPICFSELKKNYGNATHKKMHFENIAISDHSGERRLYYFSDIDKSEKEFKYLNSLSSLSRSHLEKMDRSHEIDSLLVPCKTLKDIIEKYDYWEFDLLMIDTEGSDYRILKSIDFNRIKPDLIYFEHHHFDQEQIIEINDTFNQNKYEKISYEYNTLAYQDNLLLK